MIIIILLCCYNNNIIVMVTGTRIYMHFPLTQDGATPLFIASQKGHIEVVNILIRNEANINLAKKVRYF